MVGDLVVDHAGHERAGGGGDPAAQLGADGDVPHPGGDQDLLVGSPDPLADGADVVLALPWLVRDADAAGQVHERHVDAELVGEVRGEMEQPPRQTGVVVVPQRVAREERMDAKLLDPGVAEGEERLAQLRDGHAELGVLRRADDAVCRLEVAARVDPAAHRPRELPHVVAPEPQLVEGVKVDGRAEVARQAVVGERRVARGEHGRLAAYAAGVGEHELGERGAVGSAALLRQDADDDGVGGRLDGKVLAEAGIPGECLVKGTGAGSQQVLAVQVERRGMDLGNLLQPLPRDEGPLRGGCAHLQIISRGVSASLRPYGRGEPGTPVR